MIVQHTHCKKTNYYLVKTFYVQSISDFKVLPELLFFRLAQPLLKFYSARAFISLVNIRIIDWI